MKLLYPLDLLNMPPPEWILKDVLQLDSTCLLYGPPGKGKSFLALEMAFATVSGNKSIFDVERPGPVIYVAGEGVAGIGVRVKAWQQDRNTELSRGLAVLGEPVQLADKRSRRKFIDAVEDEMEEDPTLIIFDTLARCAVGLDENSAKDMGLVIEGIDKIRHNFGSSIILVHHSTKGSAKTERGSSAIYGAVDTALSLNTDGKKYIKLECQKQKNGEEMRVKSLELCSVDPSCVIRADRDAKKQSAREKFIDAVENGVGISITKREFFEFAYPPIPWTHLGEGLIIAVTDPGGRRFMLDVVEPQDEDFQEWLKGPKDDLSFVSYPPDTDWEERRQVYVDRKEGKLKQLNPDGELEYWFRAIDHGAASQAHVAEWYGIPRQTFGRHYRKWKEG